MLEGAEEGDELDYQRYMRPASRLVKLYSRTRNLAGKAGDPEGCLRLLPCVRTILWRSIKSLGNALLKAEQFKRKRLRSAILELVKLARAAKRWRAFLTS
jgi:hypothetical protein